VSIVTYDYIDDFGSYTNVSGWTNIVAVAATWYRTIGLRADGTVVMAQGKTPVIDDRATALKPEDVKDWKNVIAIAAGSDHLVALKSDGTVVAAGDNEYGQCNVSYWRNIVAIEARGNTTIGLRADGTVVVAGIFYGGNSYSWRNIKEVTAGYFHVAGVKADGTVVATGYNNDSGQLNVGSWKEIKVP
jgi:alpha-tubulin suppressor-like RCC1 family protein